MPKVAIQVRVSTEQRDELRARATAAGLTLSDYIRSAALGDPGATAAPSARSPAGATPPAADDDLAAKVEKRAKQLHSRMSWTQARAQARRELA